ncbi:divergent polysaccharide deacetylase family protein [Paenibacillus hodogayensis]|uniref:Divergent polysaccharide deacetylase family protein n=1 Tax=Paenibacillus hodogayensis TaxID=279208 RepID=A0ABV5W4J8_9BACL
MNMKRIGLCMTALVLLLAAPQPIGAENGPEAVRVRRAAIVIDDFGNNMKGTEEMLKVPFTLTVAVMPFLPSTKKDAEEAHRNGHDVIVHLPMEPLKGNKSWLGPGAITCDLSDEEIRKRVGAAIDEVPYAIGLNNHMGSKATVDERVMRIVLEVCKERQMLFLDSHTNYRSIVGKLAREIGVPCLENHIFLDDIKTKLHVLNQVKQLQKHLSEHDTCIAIGHVGGGGKNTAEVVAQLPRTLTGVELVGISKLAAEVR